AGLPVLSRLAPKRVAEAQVVRERRSSGGVVNVIALHSLEEGSEAAAENGSARSEEVFRESDTRLVGFVVVLHKTAREAVLAREAHAVQIERNSTDCLDAIAARINRACGCPDRTGRLVVRCRVERSNSIAPLPCVRQSVITEAKLQAEARCDVPVIEDVSRGRLVHIVPDRCSLELTVSARQAQQDIHGAIAGRAGWRVVALGVTENLLVLRVPVVAEAVLHRMFALGVRDIDLRLIVLGSVVPRS